MRVNTAVGHGGELTQGAGGGPKLGAEPPSVARSILASLPDGHRLSGFRCVVHECGNVKITFVIANYPPSIGGSQLHVQRVAEGLVGLGHSVTVVTSDAQRSPGGRDAGYVGVGDEWMNGVHVKRRPVARRAHLAVRGMIRLLIRLGIKSAEGFFSLIAIGPLGVSLAREVRFAARSSDAVVGVAAPYLTIPAVRLTTHRRPAHAVYMPLLHPDSTSPRPLVSRALRHAAAVVVMTEFERTWLIDRGVHPGSIEIIPPGCDLSNVAEVSPAEARALLAIPNRPTVGFIGRMAAYKGIDTLLSAMERIWDSRPELNLLLAGGNAGWTAFDELLDRARRLGGDRLVYRGTFEENERPLLYAACDVVTSPSRGESFGITTIEAWSAKRPVICGDIAAVRSLVHHDEDGLLVTVGDVAAWTDALTSILDDDERRVRLGQAGRRRVERDFTWETIVQSWDRMLRVDVAGEPNPPAGVAL